MENDNPDPGDPEVVKAIIDRQRGLTKEEWGARIQGVTEPEGIHEDRRGVSIRLDMNDPIERALVERTERQLEEEKLSGNE